MPTTKTNMLNRLSELMIRHGAIIRAIPLKERHLYEKEHKNLYPDGEVQYVDEFKREMLVQYTTPQNAGKFCLTFAKHTMQTVVFNSSPIFDSLDQIVEYLETLDDSTRKESK